MPDEPIVDPVPDAVPEPKPFDWHTEIHPDVASDKVWESVPDLKTLTKSYADAVKYNVGAIKMPGPDASPEDWDRFHGKIGRPSAAEGYTIPEETLLDKVTLNAMRGVAHQAGLTPKQWDTMISGYERQATEQAQLSAVAVEKATEALKGEWGAAFNKKVGFAQQTLRTYFGEDVLDRVVKSGFGNDTDFIKGLAALGEALAEEGLITGIIDGVPTKDDAQRELNTLVESKAYRNQYDSGHKEAVERAQKLFEILYN